MCHLFGRLAYFALFGLVAIVAIGPVVGVAGALLPFALVGLVAFAGYRGVQRLVGKRRPVRLPDRLAVVEARREVEDALPVKEVPARPEARSGRGRVFVEMVCGGIVGGLVAGLMCWQMPELAGTIAPAVVTGVAVGYVVGGSSREKAAPVHAAEAHS